MRFSWNQLLVWRKYPSNAGNLYVYVALPYEQPTLTFNSDVVYAMLERAHVSNVRRRAALLHFMRPVPGKKSYSLR